MNLVEILQQQGVEGKSKGEHHHARGQWVQYDCPFCGKGTSKYHMGFNPRGVYFNCYKCGPHDAVKTVSEMLGVTWQQALALVKSADGGRAPELPDKPTVKRKLTLPYGLLPLARSHRDYLRERGFDPDEIIETWKVQGLCVAPPLSHRIFIPIFNRGGEMVSWTTRSIARNVELRYVSAGEHQEKESHKTLLYGEHKVTGFTSICCVEGPISMWAIGTGCVATCGTGFKREQALKLARYGTVYVCFDAEPVAQRRAKELCDFLLPMCEVYNVVLSNKDPADTMLSHPKEIQQLKRKLK